jgi:hypothetical protein
MILISLPFDLLYHNFMLAMLNNQLQQVGFTKPEKLREHLLSESVPA